MDETLPVLVILFLCGSLNCVAQSDETSTIVPTTTNSPISTTIPTSAIPTDNPTDVSSTLSTEGTTSNWSVDPGCETGELYPYKGDCTKYWECDSGVKYSMNCPEGLYFSPTLKICDYPEQAGCEYDGIDRNNPYKFFIIN